MDREADNEPTRGETALRVAEIDDRLALLREATHLWKSRALPLAVIALLLLASTFTVTGVTPMGLVILAGMASIVSLGLTGQSRRNREWAALDRERRRLAGPS